MFVTRSYQPLIGDFNGDGRSDIFWYGPGLRSTGCGLASRTASSLAGR